MRGILRTLAGTRGVTLVESALVLPLLFLLTFAVLDFGIFFYVYLAMQNGVSQAARYGVTGNTMAGMDRVQSIKAAMRQNTPTLTLPDAAFHFNHMVGGAGAWVGGVGGPGDIDKVSVDYTWRPLTPVLRPFFPSGQVNLSVESAMKNEPRVQ
jgi:hypothetical protein